MAAALFCLAAPAGEPASKIDLEKKVKELEKRVGELEKGGARAAAPQTGSDLFTAYWKDGLRLETADKQFKLKIGGRLMNDWTFIDADKGVEEALGDDLEDGVEFRYARIDISGLLYERVEFRTEYDFAGGDADFKNVYIGFLDLPVVGNLRVGHFEQPFSLEKMTSGKYRAFQEVSLHGALVPGMDTGIMLYDGALGGRMSWAAGVFRTTNDFGEGEGDGVYNLTGRLTGLPIYEDDGKTLLHLGAAFSHRDPGEDSLDFRSRPESHLVDELLDTGNLFVNSAEVIGAELALVRGQFSLQGEYVHVFVDELRGEDEDPELHGFYVFASYFLTGESRAYNLKEGAFGRVRPLRNFDWQEGGGSGAWELALRYSHLDLDTSCCDGGELQGFTAGLNWHLNPNTRIMLNYVFADLDDTGDVNVFQMRFQVDF